MNAAFLQSGLPTRRVPAIKAAFSPRCDIKPKARQQRVRPPLPSPASRARGLISKAKGQQEPTFDVVYDVQRAGNRAGPKIYEKERPVLVFVPGLDGMPLPEGQAWRLRADYEIVSICYDKADRSGWDHLVQEANQLLATLRRKSSRGLTVVGESFGAALALRVAAESSTDVIDKLVLINPGTAILKDRLLFSATSLLPLLKLDRTERVLYKAAAVFLTRVLLTSEELLAPSNLPEDELRLLRSIDIERVPLDAMLHRIALLKSFDETFPDSCLRDLVNTPTTLVASGRDRLLNSKAEVKRLSRVLPNVESTVVLENSGHAALLEDAVSLAAILESKGGTTPTRKIVTTPLPMDENKFERASKLGRRLFDPWRKLTSPKVLGKQNLRDALSLASSEGSQQRPVLLVGNHTVLGILDLSVFFIELQELLGGKRLRSLADSIHFEEFGEISGGRWTDFVSDLGAVPANARNFYRLLSASENILLFPGGAREVCRRRGEQHKLFWKSDTDFVRPAARFDAIIVPFSAIGADDCVDVLIDGQEMQKLPFLGSAITQLVEGNGRSAENLMPLTSFPPRPQPFYFKFQEPIDTADVDPSDAEVCRRVYERAKASVECGMEELLRVRETEAEGRSGRRSKSGLRSRPEKDRPQRAGFRALLESVLPTFDL